MTKPQMKALWEEKYKNPAEGGYLLTAPVRILNIRKRWEHRFFKRQIIDRFSAERLRNAVCLDVGCGDGKNTLFFAQHFGKVIGIDIAENIIERNKAGGPPKNVSFVCTDVVTYVNTAEEHFDLIFVGGVFMYLDDEQMKKVFQVLLSRLAPGGVIVLRETVSTLETRVNEKADYFAIYRHYREYCTGVFAATFVDHVHNTGYKTMRVYNLCRKLKVSGLFNRVTAPLLLQIAVAEDARLRHQNRTQNHFFFYRQSAQALSR